MKTVLIITLSFLFLIINAQDVDLKDREIVVQKEYNNEIYKVDPIFDFASIALRPKTTLDFRGDSLSGIPFITPDIDVSVRPITYKTISKKDGHKGFLKLDKGITNPIHAQGGYTYTAKNYYNVTGQFEYDHRAQSENPNQNIKTIDAGLGFNYYLTKELKVNLEVAYDKISSGLYGSQDLLGADFTDDQIGFYQISTRLGIQSFKTLPSKWNYGITTSLNDWKDNQDIGRERNIHTRGWVELQFDDAWSLDIRPDLKASISTVYGDQHVLGGAFHLGFDSKPFYLAPGLRIDYFDDRLSIWPDVDMRWNVSRTTNLDIRSTAVAHIVGAQYLGQNNTYLDYSILGTRNKEVRYDRNLSLEVEAQINSDTQIELQSIYSNIQNDINFRLSPTDIRLFTPSLVNYERLRLRLTLNRSIWDELLIGSVAVQYDKYAEQSEILLYRPTLTIQPGLTSYLLNKKLKMMVTGVIHNEQNIENIPILNSLAGWRKNISFELGYQLFNHLSINFNADNLFDDRYDVWNGYSNFGRNLSGGLLLKF